MHYWNSPYIKWHKEIPADWDIYVCQTRASRNKAMLCAVYESLSLLAAYKPRPLLVGPLSDQKGVYRLGIAREYREQIKERFKKIGYTSHVYRLAAESESPTPSGN